MADAVVLSKKNPRKGRFDNGGERIHLRSQLRGAHCSLTHNSLTDSFFCGSRYETIHFVSDASRMKNHIRTDSIEENFVLSIRRRVCQALLIRHCSTVYQILRNYNVIK